MTIRFVARPRGPLVVTLEEDPIVVRPDGSEVPLAGCRKLLLCRCGHTRSAPLCDGSHNRVPFEAPPAEPEPEPEQG